MKRIDITTTSTIRPKLLERTLCSFRENLFFDDEIKYRLVINIDPIGEECEISEVEKIAKFFFPDHLINIPIAPSFARAVIWCWKNTVAPYIFHLEDDWELLVKTDLKRMIEILENNKKNNLVSLRLSKDYVKPKRLDEGGFAYWDKISLNPSLLTGEFARSIIRYMNPNLNPEKQLRIGSGQTRSDFISKLTFGVYLENGRDACVKDIGRDWMNDTCFVKDSGFTFWRKTK
jgi:hypothetical protein